MSTTQAPRANGVESKVTSDLVMSLDGYVVLEPLATTGNHLLTHLRCRVVH